MSFDPTTWIDEQRDAGNARGNVFADILAACEVHRTARLQGSVDGLYGRRVERVKEMKASARDHDAAIDPVVRQVLTFSELQAQHEAR
ncbi:MAG: hypothetical protein H7293_20005 [Candidatus Saccharibacteria bacterium]|nr:hypothetical protein [Rhodoferax sp.]